MNWLLQRVLACLGAAVAGAAAGGLLGGLLRAPLTFAVIGALLGVAAAVIADTVKGARLVAWLREGPEHAAPRDTGFWGELGYRAERLVRSREREVAAERLRLEQFLAAIEASPNGVMLLDANDQIDWCNAAAADHFSIDPMRDRRQRVTNLVRSPDFVAALQSGASRPTEVPDPSGRGLLSVLIRPYGEGARLVLSQDITEREKVEAMRRDFVANVSHEVRTPLTVLAGFIDTLTNLPLSDAERHRVLALMGQQAQRMQSIVSDLLTLAQLEGSPRPATGRWCSIEALFAQLEADAAALSGHRHELSFACERGLEVAGAEKELLSAMSNLMTNAIRYTPEGGRIDVQARRLGDGSAAFTVQDSGIGIAREHLPRLTERFYRVDGSRSRETGGTGLGLSIVKHVVQRHAGELEIESEPGRGSTFRIGLPAARVRIESSVAADTQLDDGRAEREAASTR